MFGSLAESNITVESPTLAYTCIGMLNILRLCPWNMNGDLAIESSMLAYTRIGMSNILHVLGTQVVAFTLFGWVGGWVGG